MNELSAEQHAKLFDSYLRDEAERIRFGILTGLPVAKREFNQFLMDTLAKQQANPHEYKVGS